MLRRVPVTARTAPAAAVLVFLEDEDSFFSEQENVFVAEHGFWQGSRDGCAK